MYKITIDGEEYKIAKEVAELIILLSETNVCYDGFPRISWNEDSDDEGGVTH
jgi:hypothetical protein